MGEGLGQAIGCLITIAIAGIALTVIFGGYTVFNIFSDSVVKSPKRIAPEIKLTTDGKRVDTLFIYKAHE